MDDAGEKIVGRCVKVISVLVEALELVHLPGWAARTTLTVSVIVSVLALNGIGGVTFGYLYFTRGIEAAMFAHFAADIVLHVAGPMLPQK
jgi:membrane protease YdiL (CAAX protease family)